MQGFRFDPRPWQTLVVKGKDNCFSVQFSGNYCHDIQVVILNPQLHLAGMINSLVSDQFTIVIKRKISIQTSYFYISSINNNSYLVKYYTITGILVFIIPFYYCKQRHTLTRMLVYGTDILDFFNMHVVRHTWMLQVLNIIIFFWFRFSTTMGRERNQGKTFWHNEINPCKGPNAHFAGEI